MPPGCKSRGAYPRSWAATPTAATPTRPVPSLAGRWCCRFFGGCSHFESLRLFARPRFLRTFETVFPALGSLPLLIETVVAEV
jgi:hypothetical protein